MTLILLSLMLFLPHQVVAQCYVTSLTWATSGFSIADQVYGISDPAISISADFLTANACGYDVTYQLLNTTDLSVADSSVFTFDNYGDCQECYCSTAWGGSFSGCQTGTDTYGPLTCFNDMTYRAPGVCLTHNVITIYTNDMSKNWVSPY